MRRAAAAGLLAAALLASGLATAFLLPETPVEVPVEAAPPPDTTPPEPAVPRIPVPLPPPPPAPSPPPVEEDDGWKEYPEGVKGPVVVGVVTKYGDPDPECWVALEAADDPARPDPSVVETLEDGRFRLTGMAPGRYRVRVKEDETLPTYSRVFEARDGEVVDAGVLRLRARGCIAGVLRDREGTEVAGEVRLFGRDPATLDARVVESVPCLARQGFQLAAHEAGEYALAATAEEGFAVHRGRTDGDGLAWADLALRPWASLEADLAPAGKGDRAARSVRIVLETLEAPDLGIPAPGGNRGAPARFERLPPGRYRVRARWEEEAGGAWRPREAARDVAVAEGEAALAALPR